MGYRKWILAAVALLLSSSVSFSQQDAPMPEYRIGPEDVLGVVVWDEPNHTMDVQVRPDGKITLPLLNDIHVAGMTPEELRVKLTKAHSEHMVEPTVTVIVREFNSFKVYFLGQVTAQGVQNFKRQTRLLQAIASAGGPSQFSNKRITLLREMGGIEKRYEIDYKKLLSGDPAQENLLLQPGDTLLFY